MYSSTETALMSCPISCSIAGGGWFCSFARASASDVKYTMSV